MAINSQDQAVNLNAVTVNGSIVLEFSEAIDKETANINNLRIFTKDGNVPVTVAANQIVVSKDGKTVTVKLPTLEDNTEYKLVAKNIKTDAKGELVTEKTVEFKTSNVAVVTEISLVDAGNLSQDSNPDGLKAVKLDFNKDLDTSTVNNTNVYLVDVATGKKVSVNVAGNGSEVSAQLSTVIPVSSFAQKFKLVVENLKTTTGTTVEKYELTFTVNDSTPLAGIETYKTLDGKVLGTNELWGKLSAGTHTNATGVDYHAGLQIQVQVEERLDAASVQEYTRLFNVETEKEVAATVTYNADAKIITIVPTADLKEGTDYEVQFFGGLKSELGTVLNSYKVDEKVVAKSFATLDLTAPAIISATSKNGVSGLVVSENQDIVLEFSEAVSLNKANLLIASTNLKQNDSSTYGEVVGTADYTVTAVAGSNGKKFTVRINSNTLDVNKTYQLSVVGSDLKSSSVFNTFSKAVLEDLSTKGNLLAKSYNLVFTTEGADVTAPKLTNVFTGQSDKIAANEVTSGALKNVELGDVLTFKFDEEVNYVTGAKLQVKTNGKWVNQSHYTVSVDEAVSKVDGKGTVLEVTIAAAPAQLSVEEGITLEDAEYRIVFPVNSIDDNRTPASSSANQGNLNVKEFTFEFVGSEEDETVASLDVVALTKVSGKYSSLGAESVTTAGVESGVLVELADANIRSLTAEQVKVTDKDGNVVAGSIVLLDADNTSVEAAYGKFLFVPSADLANSSTYTITVDGITDEVGNKVAKVVKQFKTEVAGLAVSTVSIENNAVSVDRKATITFALNAASDLLEDNVAPTTAVAEGTVRLVNVTNNTTVNTDLYVLGSTDKKNYTIKFLDDNKLVENTRYKLEINPTGNNNTKTVNFTTGLAATDDVKPSFEAFGTFAGSFTPIIKTNDTYTVLTANLADNLAFDFSEDIDISGASVAITDISTDKAFAVLGTDVEDSDDAGTGEDILTVNPVLDLESGKTYKVVVSGVTDASGNVASTLTLYVVAQ